jgi:hypothetical protein
VLPPEPAPELLAAPLDPLLDCPLEPVPKPLDEPLEDESEPMLLPELAAEPPLELASFADASGSHAGPGEVELPPQPSGARPRKPMATTAATAECLGH